MKKILCLLLITIGLFQSCVPVPEEDPDVLAAPGNLSADFDGQTFVSTTETVIIDAVSMSIKAKNEVNGSYFKITLPENPIVGTYTWAEGFTLKYFDGIGPDAFVAAKDDSGTFANFPNYTDTAQLVILGIDKVNKRISGTFKFTGVRFTDVTHTAVETKVFTNGFFQNLAYTAVNPNATVLVKKITDTDADTTVESMEYFYTDDNKLDYTIDGYGNRTNYTYNSADLLIEEITYVGTSATIIEKSTYAYNASSKLETYVNIYGDVGTRITYDHNSDGTIDYQEYSGDSSSQDVLGSNGTLSITRHIENYTDPFTLESQVYTGEFTFDSKNNPFKNVIGYDKVYFADSDMALNFANNVLQHTDQIDSDPAYILETLSYTYNSANYPTQIVHRGTTGDIESTEDIVYY